MKLFRFAKNVFLVCSACLSSVTVGICAEASKTDADRSFSVEVLSRFNFEANAVKFAVAHTKAKMISMPDAGCISDDQERIKFLNKNLLGSGSNDQIIQDALKNSGALEDSLHQWVTFRLGQLSESSKHDLLAIPSNALSDEIVGSWLWGRFDSTPMFQLNGAATEAWAHICKNLANRATGHARKAAQTQ